MQKNWGRAMLYINVQQQLGRLTHCGSAIANSRCDGYFGLSGSGKTSLINLVGGLTHPRSKDLFV